MLVRIFWRFEGYKIINGRNILAGLCYLLLLRGRIVTFQINELFSMCLNSSWLHSSTSDLCGLENYNRVARFALKHIKEVINEAIRTVLRVRLNSPPTTPTLNLKPIHRFSFPLNNPAPSQTPPPPPPCPTEPSPHPPTSIQIPQPLLPPSNHISQKP